MKLVLLCALFHMSKWLCYKICAVAVEQDMGQGPPRFILLQLALLLPLGPFLFVSS